MRKTRHNLRRFTVAYDSHPNAGKVEPIVWSFPPGFTVIVDTREQAPLFLPKPPKDLMITRGTLTVGDYSVWGFENCCAIERKSLSDFYGSIGKGRERFRKELEVLQHYEFKALVIEGDERDQFIWQDFSNIHPNSVRATIVSIEVRLHIPVHFFNHRSDMERWVLDRLLKFYRIKREGEQLSIVKETT